MVTARPNRTRPGVGLTRSRMWQRCRSMRPIASTRSAHLRSVASIGRVSWLTEREGVRLGVGLEECDLQRPLPNSVVLADELVQAAVAKDAVAVLGDLYPVGAARSPARAEHAE